GSIPGTSRCSSCTERRAVGSSAGRTRTSTAARGSFSSRTTGPGTAGRPGRRIVDEVDDVAALADHLGLERFGVTGGSGGGAHSLACAARLPDRVVRAACVVGVAPFGDAGLDQDDWLAGMDPENIKEFGWAVAGEEVLMRELEAEYTKIAALVADDPTAVLGDFDLSDSDRKELARKERAQIIRESWAEHSARGVGGWADDDLAHIRPWGFEVGEITL